MSKKKSISILGCGWLGVPLACHLIEKGYLVNGSYRDIDNKSTLINNSIEPYQINLADKELLKNTDSFFDVNYLIISIPPGRSPAINKQYADLFTNVIESANRFKLEGVIFLSSTSVYPASQANVSETCDDSPDKPVGHAILAAEKKLSNDLTCPITILRLAGLIGYDRVPQNYLKDKKVIRMSDGPVNLIHRDDCIRIIEGVLNKKVWKETVNVCYEEHPTRKEYYQAAADKYNFELPPFENSDQSNFKIVDNAKLKNIFGNDLLKYSNPLELFR
ncbi:MAG: NAD(P)-dependent oxidoreductase [Planctomycetota bacterium]|nr:MAG: NAD(P)-dependent oxidoreductase [Planctomycetota bacterium]